MTAPAKPVVKPDTDTPTRTRPSRPGVVPDKDQVKRMLLWQN